MICPKCKSDITRVYDTRKYDGDGEELKAGVLQRRRICVDCNFRFSTVELLGTVRVRNGEAIGVEIDND